MNRQTPILGKVAVIAALGLLLGCQPQQPYYFHDSGDLSHYKKMATEIEYPDVNVEALGDVQGAAAPLTLAKTEPKEFWDLSLEEAMRDALANGKVLKQIGGAAVVQAGSFGPMLPDNMLRNPQGAPTMYDPAIVEADPRFGVETALSAFDAQLSASMLWEKHDRPTTEDISNTAGIPAPIAAGPNGANVWVLQEDVGTFQAQLKKVNAYGGIMTLTDNVSYLASNSNYASNPNFQSAYNVNVEAAVQQPLLRGGGLEFNRIAGPGGFPGFLQGVMIARVNTDVALASFEANVRNMVADVENSYWELYFAYRNLDTVQEGLRAALQTWQKTYALMQVGAKGGEADKEAQAREEYFVFRASTERALNAMYHAESNLRYMMGIAASDGRLIRPSDEPTTAKVTFDWCTVHNEAMVRSVELRQQKWIIKKRELELIAAKNFLLPQLDAIARYRYLGLGHSLVDDGNSFGDFSGAYNNLLDGQFQEWALGFQFSMPLGFRKEMAGVRSAQLNLAKERTVLQEQELELSHQMTGAIRDLEGQYVLSQTNYNRMLAARRQVDAVRAAYEDGTVGIDVLLNAQRQLAQAESDYFRSIADYTKAITMVHFRKGSLLEYNGVYLAEGPWPAKAYFDATRLARARGAAHYFDYGFSKPRVVSRGPYQQNANEFAGALPPSVEQGAPAGAGPNSGPEVVPTPQSAPGSEPVVPAAPTPAPAVPVPSPGPQASGPQLNWPQASSGPAAASQQRAGAGVAGKYDGGQGNPGAVPAAEEAPPTPDAVRQTGFESSGPALLAPTNGPVAGVAAGWTSTDRTTSSHASNADVPTAASDWSAAGWTRAQH